MPTAREVVEHYIEASGGQQYIQSIRSLRVEGIVAIPNVSYKKTIYLYEPGRTCLIAESPDESILRIIYDRGKAIEILNGDPTPITDALRLERMKLFSYLQAEIGYLKENYKLEFVNTEMINGRLQYRIKVTSPLGAVTYKLYDADTGQLTLLADATGNKTTYSNYETQDGLTFPLSQQTIGPTGRIMNIQMTKRLTNKLIDPKLFEFK